jgi:hypothetical protein
MEKPGFSEEDIVVTWRLFKTFVRFNLARVDIHSSEWLANKTMDPKWMNPKKTKQRRNEKTQEYDS